MGASASVSLIPLRPDFDLGTVQDVVGEEWTEDYEKQFQALANEREKISYDTFVRVYQRNLLAQSSACDLLKLLQKKFTKVLSGEGNEEAAAAVRMEKERRKKEALDVPWACPQCACEDQTGPSCGICTADNPKLAAILAEDDALKVRIHCVGYRHFANIDTAEST